VKERVGEFEILPSYGAAVLRPYGEIGKPRRELFGGSGEMKKKAENAIRRRRSSDQER
jgi:hypothetical protein